MADIAAERAWMQQRAADAAAAEEAEIRRRWIAGASMTCAYCFHATHVIVYASESWSGRTGDPWKTEPLGPPIVLWCPTPDCRCGVPPCPGCDEQVRPIATPGLTQTCPSCGLVTGGSAYA